MHECCTTCRKWLNLTMYDYGHGGCEHYKMGHVCTLLSDEGTIIWMVGNDPGCEVCEGYEPKEG